MAEFHYEGHRIEFDSYGEGDRVLILVHGLLMNRRMFERLGPALADQGNRVICVDLLGHGRSDRPEDLRLYSMPLFARQVSALIDHLGLDSAVVGGTSLGANVGLELATREPEKVRALVVEMPVLDNALSAVAGAFTPVMLGLKLRPPRLRGSLAGDLGDPPHPLPPRHRARLGAAAPRALARRTRGPAARRDRSPPPGADANHPTDPDRRPQARPDPPLQRLGNARRRAPRRPPDRSQLDLRVAPHPGRLNAELAEFLDEVWAETAVSTV